MVETIVEKATRDCTRQQSNVAYGNIRVIIQGTVKDAMLMMKNIYETSPPGMWKEKEKRIKEYCKNLGIDTGGLI